ncbi:SxtJ family membrane protein [Pelagibacteraceae bacterium]|nr:SxtJ family membrane protein [Pelagibacteraceae bacterium]
MKNLPEKKFGLMFSIIFFVIGVWPMLSLRPLNIWLLALAFTLLAVSLAKPSLLKPLNYYWIKLGELLGKLIAPIVMGFIFFIIVTPIGFIVKAMRKDLLKLKFSNDTTYWIKRKDNIKTMDKQF